MPGRDGIPTINDVADLAGVSKRTVSRVINNSDKVNKRTREHVEAKIKQLNFTPNSQARGLAARRSFLLGLIYDVPTLFINEVQKGIMNVCNDAGYDIVVHPCEIGSENLVNDVQRFVNRSKVDGVIMLPPISEMSGLAVALDQINVPHVSFASDLSAESWRLVITNYEPAVTDMTDHLVALNHTRIGFISGPRHSTSSKKREQAFVQSLASHGLKLPESMIVEGAFTYESGVQAARELLNRKVRPTAIFAANDEMAFGVMKVADGMGISIPGDLSVVGFDGTPLANFVIPSLTTIRRPSSEMAQLGTQKLLAFINDGLDAARAYDSMVSPQFIPRDSTGPAAETK